MGRVTTLIQLRLCFAAVPQTLHLIRSFQQFSERAFGLDLTIFEHNHMICLLQNTPPMGDDQASWRIVTCLPSGKDPLPQDAFSLYIKCAGKIIKDEQFGITPDVMCLAKSLGGGVPIGAVVTTPAYQDVLAPGDHGSTFAGGPLACAAALASCGVIEDPKLLDHVNQMGVRLMDGLRELVAEGLAENARGRGLMCAIDIPHERAQRCVSGLLDEGFLANNTSTSTVRFLPPLVIDSGDIDGLLDALRRVLRQLA